MFCRRRMLTAARIIAERVISPTDDNFLRQAMEPIYNEVMQIKGQGAPQKRCDEFEKRVCSPSGVWTTFHDKIQSAFEELFSDEVDILSQEIEAVFNIILGKFNLMCDNAEAKTEEEKALEEDLRCKMQKNLVLARAIVEGPVAQLANDCKNYSINKEQTSLFVPAD